MAPTITLVYDDSNPQQIFARLLALAGDFSAPIKDSVAELAQLVRQTFRDEASPWGEPWAPHSPVTLRERTRKKNTRISLLFATGAMFSSIKEEADATSGSVTMGGEDIWAAVHQFGNPTNKAWGGVIAPIPARPMFPIRPNNEADLPEAWAKLAFAPFEKAINEAIK